MRTVKLEARNNYRVQDENFKLSSNCHYGSGKEHSEPNLGGSINFII